MIRTSADTTKALARTPVLILAGGVGNRLLPLTLSRPKPMLAFGPCRLIDFTLANCRESGLTHCALLTQYKQSHIQAHIEKAWRGAFQCFSPVAGMSYHGTADAAFQNSRLFEDADHVLILAGDHVYQMDYRELLQTHLDSNADLTLSTIESPLHTARNFGVLEVDDNLHVTDFVEKPAFPKPMPNKPDASLVSMGIYVFKVPVLLEALRSISPAESGLDFGFHVVPGLIKSRRVVAHKFGGDSSASPRYWKDIGDIDSYYSATMDFIRNEPPFLPHRVGLSASGPDLEWFTAMNTNRWECRIRNSHIASGVQVANGAEIEDSILMPNVQVGRGAKLRRVIVDEGVRLPEGFSAGWRLDSDRRQHVVTRSGIVVITNVAGRMATGVGAHTLSPRHPALLAFAASA
jgi:glucose-1-phosphate adenylyltransferase